MLQLHRTLHCSISVSLGLSFGLARPRPACRRSERFSSMQAMLSTVCEPWAVPVASPLCPPTDSAARHRAVALGANRLVYPPCESARAPAASDASAPGVYHIRNICASGRGGASSPCRCAGASALALVEHCSAPFSPCAQKHPDG